MIVVSNTSPIMNLAAIGQLDLLRHLYGRVIIPQAVYNELASRPDLPGGTEVQSSDWIATEPAGNAHLVQSLLVELDRGEAEAIALALELKADLVLIDERLGRRIAGRLGLRFVGVLGVLIEAKHAGRIGAVKPLVDDLADKAGFWISPALRTAVLDRVGE
ncbi:MAG: DUF3368 domain-containing protein [Pirellulales bacterium]|nr:DUF3368 domain-containing protein [Pirellulales bacterium]